MTREAAAILVVDMVESVRLIGQDEEGVVCRWLKLVDRVVTQVLPARGGRLVKSLGDGMLLEFGDVRLAASAAFAIQQESAQASSGLPADEQMFLRMGIEVGDVIVDHHDIYGRDVNLAARLASLAGPNEVVISAQARDLLTPTLDAEIEDLGECYVKHIQQPLRAYRIGPAGPRPVVKCTALLGELRPSIAIIPFVPRPQAIDQELLGEVLAEEIIRAFSRCPDIAVLSRLSTTAFRWRQFNMEDVRQHLGANFVLSGSYRADDHRVTLNLELAEVRSQRVVWADQLAHSIPGILNGQQELISQIVSKVANAIQFCELQRARSSPLPTLESYSLLMSAITLMHRMSAADFSEARHLLQALIERAPRHAVPHSWMAQWYVLRIQQGWTEDSTKDRSCALDCTKRALDTDPDSSLALAVSGLVHTHMTRELDIAAERYALAVRANSNNSLAWLLKGTLHAFRDEGAHAVADTQRAIRLSPLDPHRYYYDTLAATAYLAARKYELALKYARRSLKANRRHTSTLRAMAIAQWQLGHDLDARQTVAELMSLEPGLTITGYLRRTPSAGCRTGQEWSSALRQAGVPG
ncbi:adenylate/guanylate cyclase domain-containing protein [Bradyrhizobium sp. CB82]|uniref:adenylate/guanylate cyclase domain-containing protein n=1 Tax=Bradyrhizobium sp. CB82 TaxID=3039159 RepID=UPI0024B0A721|nr:adenylate/guanylate cyclase domain-containing protein [Bradyrhizobium sp. CB82]WFU44141.1 adenylate/guanylate cyclase domain-containing protein [Bradyrhizobium sp. CB82]